MKKVLSLALAFIIMLGAATTAFAAESGSQKEEVVYIVADVGGAVQSINVVNIFGSDPSRAGRDITDYGDYSTVKMLTTNDTITRIGDTTTFSTTASKAYYQGTMKSAEIPWDIGIRYYLDGTEYSGIDMAGKSGKLEIRFKVSKNVNYNGTFFEDYALQASFTLNTERADNLIAADATAANVGKNKQLTFTILPGKGIDTSITADVTDFEMDAVSINGVKLNLNIDVDYSELTEKTDELTDGIVKLDDGANELKDGVVEFKDGISSLNSGVSELKDGIKTAQDGLDALNAKSGDLVNGSAEIKAALATISSYLSGVSAAADNLETLVSASGAIKTAIGQLYEGAGTLKNSLGYSQYKALMGQNGLDIDTLKAGNTQAISGLNEQIANLQGTLLQISDVHGMESQAAELTEQIGLLQNIVQLLTGSNAAIGGTESYLNGLSSGVADLYNGLNELNGKYDEFDKGIAELAKTLSGTMANLSKLANGINTLAANYAKLDSGIVEYTNGVSQLASGYTKITNGISSLAQGGRELTTAAQSLYDGTTELTDGTGELRGKTSDMDSQINEKINEMLDSARGNGGETVSFVSDKNTNVKSVQFVIRTMAIEKADATTAVPEPKETLNFWHKLLRLFGWY